MALSAREQGILDGIEKGLAGEDPALAVALRRTAQGHAVLRSVALMAMLAALLLLALGMLITAHLLVPPLGSVGLAGLTFAVLGLWLAVAIRVADRIPLTSGSGGETDVRPGAAPPGPAV